MKRTALLSLLLTFCSLLPQAGQADDCLAIRREQRRIEAHHVKVKVAHFDEKKQIGQQTHNCDERLYKDLRGSFGKTLEHKCCGFQKRSAFESLLCALNSGKPGAFNRIELGEGVVKLQNPQASFAFSLAGNDGWVNTIPPAPSFASAQAAAEMVELFWTVQVRDVPFNHYHSDHLVAQAVRELSQLCDFYGPKIDCEVTPQTFLRGNAPCELVGPYISQFLYLPIPFGATKIPPYYTFPNPTKCNDFLTCFDDWFTVIDGGLTCKKISYAEQPSFIRTARDLAEYVHRDTPLQAGLSAALILNSYGAEALDSNNPYQDNCTQVGFVTFGIADLEALLAKGAEEALKAAWYQKWLVHRRLRPEEFGFYLQQQMIKGTPLCIDPQLLNSDAIRINYKNFCSFYLPQAYPEGAPAHPSYPAGHAAIIGAAATILKAFFDEEFVIPHPVEPNDENSELVDYERHRLTLGGELNKLASNIALGRDHAGVNYRSDSAWGLRLGEKVAIDLINNWSFLYNENFKGFHLTTFDGERILVGGKCCGR